MSAYAYQKASSLLLAYFEPERFLELIVKRAVDVLQPDVGHVGGMLEAKKIAGLAHMRYLPVAPHNPTGPVMNAMTIHLAASIPNFQVLETIAADVPWRSEIVREDLAFTAGEIVVPKKSGLGVELNEAACARYPHKSHEVPFFNGTMSTSVRPEHGVSFLKTAN